MFVSVKSSVSFSVSANMRQDMNLSTKPTLVIENFGRIALHEMLVNLFNKK